MGRTYIILLGPAGCGKSTLTASLGSWIEREIGFKVAYVNLDPGAEYLPYRPDYDIRRTIRLPDLMVKERLGPNGAMIRSMELLAEIADKLAEDISKLDADFVLVDTPGQMEPFTFRRAGPLVLSAISRLGPTLGIFIVDPELASSASGLLIVYMLGVVVQLRLGVPSVIVINKADLMKDGEIDQMLSDPEYLKARLEKDVEGAVADLAMMISDAVVSMAQASRVVKVSAKTGEGLDQLYDLIHEAFCTCGDLT